MGKKERVELGKRNSLTIVRKENRGFFLDGKELGEIFLPAKELLRSSNLPQNPSVGQKLPLFLYKDSDNRLMATSQIPLIQVGQFGCLKVVATTTIGTFLDWGLDKDLFLPYSEQRFSIREGDSLVVFCYLDNASRITASSRIERHLKKLESNPTLVDRYENLAREGEPVELLVYAHSDLGYNCIINNEVKGLLFQNELFRPLSIGEKLTGYIKTIREKGKIDLVLEKKGYEKIEGIAERLIQLLGEADGFLPLNDDSSPQLIYETVGVSKKNFKKAIGALYKAHRIVLEPEGIRLLKK